MPVDLFPAINIPEVVVATFFNGMPPEEIETEITGRFERFFTHGQRHRAHGVAIAAGSKHHQSLFSAGHRPRCRRQRNFKSVDGRFRRLPPGTLPPVVEKFDASSLPVCLITLQGQGLSETQLRDLGQFQVRNQLAGCRGLPFRRPSEASTARSWCTSIPRNCRRIN